MHPTNGRAASDPDPDEPAERSPLRPGRMAAFTVVAALLAFWIWAFTLAPSDRVDQLTDTHFTERTAARCEATMTALDALPLAHETPDAHDRADVLDRANALLRGMVAGIRAEAATLTGQDLELVDRWLDDWDAYLASRERFASQIREDPEARFTVPGRPGGQITQTMDGFSRTNDMRECFVPLDV